MHIVDTTEISARDWLLSLVNGKKLCHFVHPYNVACFVLSRSAETPQLFDALVDHISTIDSTTRWHVAFIGFQSRTTLVYPFSDRHLKEGGRIETKISGISTSWPAGGQNTIDLTLKELMQYSPTGITRRSFTAEMTKASDAVLDLWRIDEEHLPALIFVEAHDPARYFIVRISKHDTFTDMYDRVLKPLSRALGHYDMLARAHVEMERAHTDMSNYQRRLTAESSMRNKLTELQEQKDALLCTVDNTKGEEDFAARAKKVLELYQESKGLHSSFTSRQRRRIGTYLDILREANETPLHDSGLLANRRLEACLLDFGESGPSRGSVTRKHQEERTRLEGRIESLTVRLSKARCSPAVLAELQAAYRAQATELSKVREHLKHSPVQHILGEISEFLKSVPFHFVECFLSHVPRSAGERQSKTYCDVFLCHASEDKAQVVEPLVAALEAAGVSVWFDKGQIRWGDSISGKINEGLLCSALVIVVMSPSFLRKKWPEKELFAAISAEATSSKTKVLPLLVGQGDEKDEILSQYPLLRDKLYREWTGESHSLVNEILEFAGKK